MLALLLSRAAPWQSLSADVMEDARALLNGLMGADRNAKLDKRKARKFSDEDICRKFLLGLCPHEMFTNTKMDLGPCGKTHNEHLKDVFEADKDFSLYRRKWRGILRMQLKQLLGDVDRRIETNQSRIASDKDRVGTGDKQSKELTALREEMSEQLKQAERAADDGKFEESRAIMKDTDAVKRRIEDIESRKLEKGKKPIVCEICGLMVSAEEAEDIKKYGRGWHTDGKQHLGFIVIREKLAELEKQRAEDKKNGLRTPSPSPVRVVRTEAPPRKRSRTRSPAAVQRRVEGRRREGSPRQGSKGDDIRRRVSRSRSRRLAARQPRSPAKRASPSARPRSRSRRREEPSRAMPNSSGKRSSPSREKRRSPPRRTSPRRASPKRESRSRESSRPPPPTAPPPPPPSASDGEKAKQAEKKSKHARKDGNPKQQPSSEQLPDAPRVPEKPKLPKAATDAPKAEEVKQKPKPPSKPVQVTPVRFVLGLGSLNVTSLGKRGL